MDDSYLQMMNFDVSIPGYIIEKEEMRLYPCFLYKNELQKLR